jgi:hypothetical protein
MRTTHENLTYRHPDGAETKYEIEMAGKNELSTEVVVLRNTREQDRPVQSVELPVAMGLASATGQRPDRISIFSQRIYGDGQERYELVTFAERGKDQHKNPIYAQDRSEVHTKRFTKEEVEAYLQRADKKQSVEPQKDQYNLAEERINRSM